MEQADLEKLERRVDDLINACRRLGSENHALKANQAGLSKVNSDLHEKMRIARTRIEAMIGRLKALERS